MCFDALVTEPHSDLVDADDQSFRALRDGNRITYVIAVPVADEDEVCFHRIGGDGRGRVPIQERIDNDFMPIGFEPKSGMSVPGQFRGHVNLLLV
jgi:hypothetical protein